MPVIIPAPVLIIGAGAGLGAFLAHEFARHGCDVGLVARNPVSLQSVVDTVHERLAPDAPVTVVGAVGDSSNDSIIDAIETISRRIGDPEIVIFNVRTLQEPVLGWARVVQTTLPMMLRSRRGLVLATGAPQTDGLLLGDGARVTDRPTVHSAAKTLRADLAGTGVDSSFITLDPWASGALYPQTVAETFYKLASGELDLAAEIHLGQTFSGS
jgi:NADP-dependent 3-hydroxy acid dehydrogenase YdfG